MTSVMREGAGRFGSMAFGRTASRRAGGDFLIMSERERRDRESVAVIGFGKRCRYLGPPRRSSDSDFIATAAGLARSIGDAAQLGEVDSRCRPRARALGRTTGFVARRHGHDMAVTFARLKGHAWPQ